MEVFNNIENLQLHNTIVTLGKFDGKHTGHKLLFDKAISLKQDDMKAVVFTFDINPNNVLKDDAFRTINSRQERSTDDFPEGIDYIVEFPFNKETMSMEPELFVKNILVDKLDVKAVVVGSDFRFGRNRSGDVYTLKALGKAYGFKVYAMDKLTYKPSDCNEAREISSTLIKDEILKGNMEDVTNMLGKPYHVVGEVLHGKHLGNTIGFPTINQSAPSDKVLPPDGVYATKTIIDGKEYLSITNIGKRPSFEDGNHRNVETNIFDYKGDLYGKNLRVDFYKFIRPERVFDGLEDLKNEIARNKVQVLEYFNNK